MAGGSISTSDWVKGCEGLHDAWLASTDSSTGWDNMMILKDSFGAPMLRMAKSLTLPPSISGANKDDQDDPVEDDDDHEALTRPPISDRVYYEIILSPSYCVPVLYITFPSRPLPTADEIHNVLLPPAVGEHAEDRLAHPAVPPMQAIGPLGALSLSDHPRTSRPAYFVHPCRTAEAMKAILGDREYSAAEYLVTFIGLIGGAVGLDVPLTVARHLSQKDSK